MSALHATSSAPASWPVSERAESRVTEILLHNSSVCLQPLLLPMVASLSHRNRWLVLINPPDSIDRQVLKQAGACTAHILTLTSQSPEQTEQLCAQALAAGTCHTVIAWGGSLAALELGNLNQAAALGDSLGILVRT